MVIMLTTVTTLKIGQSSADNENLTNVVRILFEPQPTNRNVKPIFALTSTLPIGFHKPHKYVIGEIHCASEAYHAFKHNGKTNKQYIKPDGDNEEIPYVVATVKDKNGDTWTYTFNGFLPVDDPGDFDVAKEVVRVYPFVCTHVTETPPT